MSQAKKGKVPWNKGISWKKKNKKSRLIKCLVCKKEKEVAPNQIKKGFGKFCSRDHANVYNAKLGEEHPNWKGDGATYWAIHALIYRRLGKAKKCKKCGSEKYIQWANISHKYKRDLSDWKQLCVKCHRHYDKNFKFAKELRFGKIIK